MAPIITITADRIAAVHMIEAPVAAIEFHNGTMILADVEDLDEHGEAITLGLPGTKFPRRMKHEDRVQYMRNEFYRGA